MRLKDSVLQKLKENKRARRALEDLHDKSFYTIDTWIKNNDIMLCHHTSLKVIAAYLEMEIEEMIIEEPETVQPCK